MSAKAEPPFPTPNRRKLIPIGEAAINVLKSIPRRADNPYVIIGTIEGQHLTDMQKPWRRLRSRAGLDDLRIHDLRHSFASDARQFGQDLTMIDKPAVRLTEDGRQRWGRKRNRFSSAKHPNAAFFRNRRLAVDPGSDETSRKRRSGYYSRIPWQHRECFCHRPTTQERRAFSPAVASGRSSCLFPV